MKFNIRTFFILFICMFLLTSCSKFMGNQNQNNVPGQKIYTASPESTNNSENVDMPNVQQTDDINKANQNSDMSDAVSTDVSGEKDNDSGQTKESRLVMKIFVNLGMDEYYKVLDMNDKTVTYSYYNYENTDTPELAQKTVTFDKLMEIEQGVRKYLFFAYLDDGSEEVKLEMSEDFLAEVENNPNFRVQLGKFLNKPFSKKLVNNTITSSDIK